MVRVRRRGAAIGTLVLCAWLGLTACTPGEATPTPTPTGFTSEEEAFAAAEATYRAYVDALNRVDLSDPATFEDVYAWTTGDALSEEKRGLSEMRANGWSVSGSSSVVSVTPESYSGGTGRGDLIACLDVSAVQLVDAGGKSQVSPERPDVQTIHVAFRFDDGSPTGALLTSLGPFDGQSPCT